MKVGIARRAWRSSPRQPVLAKPRWRVSGLRPSPLTPLPAASRLDRVSDTVRARSSRAHVVGVLLDVFGVLQIQILDHSMPLQDRLGLQLPATALLDFGRALNEPSEEGVYSPVELEPE